MSHEDNAAFAEIIKALAIHETQSGGIHNLLTKYGTPSNIVKQGVGIFKASETLHAAYEYYHTCRSNGYSVQLSIEGATRGAIIGTVLREGGEHVIIYSAEVAAIGLGEIATGVGVGPGLVTLGVAGTGALIGGTVAHNSKQVGSDVALSYCFFASKGGFFKSIPGALKGFFSKSPGSNQIQYKQISNLTAAEAVEFKSSIRSSRQYTAAQKSKILKDFDDQREVKSYLENELGYNYSNVPPKGLSLLAKPIDAFSMVPFDKSIIPVGPEGETQFAYDLAQYGFNLPQGSPGWNSIQNRLAQRGGVLTPNGQFNTQAVWRSLVSASDGITYEIVSSDTLASIDQKLNSLFKLSKDQSKKLDELLKNTTVTLPDGSQISVGDAVGKLIAYNVVKELQEIEQAKREAKYKNDIACAQIVTALGGLLGSPEIMKFGTSLEIIINMGYAAPRALAGDLTAIATILSCCLNFVGLFKKNKTVDPNQVILKCLQNISAQIQELKEIIIQNNLQLLDAIDRLFHQMLEGFQNMYLEIYISRLLTSQKLDQLQQDMHYLSIQLNKQINGVWLRDLLDARFTIANYISRYGSLQNLPNNPDIHEELERTANTLVNWCTNKSGHLNSTGGHLYYRDCSADKVLAVLTSADAEDLIGFLMRYMKNEFSYSSETFNDAVANPSVWILAATTFMEMMSGIEQGRFYQRYDPRHNIYKELLLSGTKLLAFFEGMRNDTDIFILLLARYYKIVNSLLKPLFLRLLNEKRTDAQSKKNSDALLSERSKVNTRVHQLNVHCAIELPVSPHENNAAQVRAVINHWNNTIAKDVVPKFIVEYKMLLDKELNEQRSLDLPLTLFYVTQNDYLLPLSVIFKTNANVANAFKLPAQLLTAEKLGIGSFDFQVSPINPFSVGPAQNNPANITLHNLNIVVTITYKYSDHTINVGTVTLQLTAANHHPAVNAVRNAATINSQYGAETGNPFYQNAVSTLSKVALLSAWMNAQVQNHTLTFDPASNVVQLINGELQNKQITDIASISSDIEAGVPRTVLGGEAYAVVFSDFLRCLNELDVCYHLLLSFAHLAGLSEEASGKLKLLWRRRYVIDVINHLYQSAIPVPAPDAANQPVQVAAKPAAKNAAKPAAPVAAKPAAQNAANPPANQDAQKTQGLVTAFQTFDHVVDIHLTAHDDHTSNSLHAALPEGSISYIEVDSFITTELLTGKSKPYISFNPVQIAILSHLRSLVKPETLRALNINISEDWLEENLAWYTAAVVNIIPQPAPVVAATPYGVDEIEKLLVRQFEDPISFQKVLPVYSPNPNLPIFLRLQFEKSIETLLRSHFNKGIRMFLPVLLSYETDNEKTEVWVLVLIIYYVRRQDATVRRDATVLLIDPRGNGRADQAPQEVDTSIAYENQDELKQSLVLSIIKSFQLAAIPIQHFRIIGMRQISREASHQSGPLLILNAQKFMNQQPMDPDPLATIDQIRLEQKQLLDTIKSENPALKTTPVEIDISTIIMPPIVGVPPTTAPVLCNDLAIQPPALKPAAVAAAAYQMLIAKPAAKPMPKMVPEDRPQIRPM